VRHFDALLGEQRVEVGVRLAHGCRHLFEPAEGCAQVGDCGLDVLPDGLALIQRRLLLEQSDGVSGRQPRLAVGRLIQPGHDLEDAGFPGAVGPDHADLGAGQE
jgi:hypothetical protein